MKLTKKLRNEIEAMMNDYWASYFEGNLDHWANYLVEDYRNIGGTEEEIWDSKKEILDYTYRVIDQMKGLSEIRNKKIQIIPYDPYFMVHEMLDIYIKIENEWNFYQKFRLSSLIQKIDNQWKVLHQHGSYPDSKTQEGEAFAVDEVKVENRKLKDAIKRRTIQLEEKNRELEIETSLERVRARTMAMQNSQELAETASVLFQQIKALGFETWSCGFCTWQQNDMAEVWMGADSGGLLPPMMIPYKKEPTHHNIYKALLTGADAHEKIWEGKALNRHYDFLRSIPSVSIAIKQLEDAGLSLPTKQCYYVGFFKQGYLLLITKEPNAEMPDISKRFAKVFEQAYTRFLDLQKAEAQARESQIEAAVERVRAQSMAMHRTTDLDKVNKEILNQMQWLKVQDLTGVSLYFLDDDGETRIWDLSSPGNMGDHNIYSLKYNSKDYKVLGRLWRQYKKFQAYFTMDFPLETLQKAVEEFKEIDINIANVVNEAIQSGNLKHQWNAFGKITGGALGIDLLSPPSEDTKAIVIKMAGAFNLAYQRFLDLQKAEAQAREAEIELALERVRAKTMAMQKSEELSETVYMLFQQFKELGENPDQATIGVINEDEKVIEYWVTMHGNPINKVFKFPIDEPNVTNKIYNAWKENKKSLVIDLSGRALKEFMTYRAGKGGAAINPKEKRRIINVAFFSKGLLNVQSNEEGSVESIKLLERFAVVFEQTYTRFLDLQKAEAQAREAEIELALERVRARTMAMQHSDELADASFLLDQQIRGLGIKTRGCAFNIYGEKESTEWFSSEMGTMPTYKTPREKVFLDYYDASQKGETFLTKEFSGKECVDWYNYLCTLPIMGDGLKQMIAAGGSFPTRQIDHVSYFKYGYLLFLTFEPVPEAHDIFKRFAKVFEQTYTRFLDLQKAEAQAREAQIEAALEKVRSRSMGMQKSEELKEVIKVVYEQFVHVNINVEHTGFIMDYKQRDDMHIWLADKHGVPSEIFIQYFDSPHWNSFREAKEKGNNFFANDLNYEEKNKFYKSLFKLFPVPDEAKEYYFNCPALAISTVLLENVGLYIENFSGIAYSDDENNTLMRFGKVFQQTYTRFLDLQNAEAQTREAQINLAVERVRARALAMFKSDEILEVVFKLKEEVMNLDIPGVAAATIHLKEKNGMHRMWDLSSFEQDGEKMHLPLDIIYKLEESDPNFYIRKIWGNAQQYFLVKQDKKDLKITTDWLRSNGKVKQADEADQFINSVDFTFLYHPTIQLNNGRMSIDLFDQAPSEEIKSILTKMGAAFDLAYKRFEDLKNSEAQLKEAQIEAALEKVRSRSLAMHKSDEIGEVVWTVVERMKELKVELNGISIITYIPDSQNTLHWHVNPEVAGNSSTMLLPYFDDLICNDCFEAKEKGIELLAKVYTKEQKDSYFNKAVEVSDFKYFPEELKKWVLEQPCLSFSFAIQNHSGIFLEDYAGKIFSKEENDILIRFSRVFEQSYVRFLDLQKAEAQALKAEHDLIEIKNARLKAEDALVQLQQTQKQLIQSEKMASLGELTAGIAHEIQNPLNFVNNFSEVSKELLEEMKEAMEKGDAEEAKEIMNDVIQNLEKINHHGKRADGIVKGMLQHSQSSKGQKEPTDINALCDEYLRLSYHGLRAKDNSFNATIKTDFDNSIGKINIITQDIGRVLLNLINNAFYAVAEKAKMNIDNYEPTVSIKTLNLSSPSGVRGISISVTDNGNGIPQKILDKIFQPFFTTKPTGSGTGLGLSLSYDIIKAHVGEIKVESKEGEGTTFIITIPITN